MFSDNNVGFVTRIKDNAVYSVTEELLIEDCIHSGVLEDTIIEVSFCRIHLFNYIHLFNFLENPEKDWQKQELNLVELTLF